MILNVLLLKIFNKIFIIRLITIIIVGLNLLFLLAYSGSFYIIFIFVLTLINLGIFIIQSTLIIWNVIIFLIHIIRINIFRKTIFEILIFIQLFITNIIIIDKIGIFFNISIKLNILAGILVFLLRWLIIKLIWLEITLFLYTLGLAF